MATQHILIKGKVQGVFFRATARKIAYDLHLTGWIRNTPAGDVEALATGSPEALSAFVDWCKQGPSGARVSGINVTEKPEEKHSSFDIRH